MTSQICSDNSSTCALFITQHITRVRLLLSQFKNESVVMFQQTLSYIHCIVDVNFRVTGSFYPEKHKYYQCFRIIHYWSEGSDGHKSYMRDKMQGKWRNYSQVIILGEISDSHGSTYQGSDGGSKHLWNVSKLLPHYTVKHPGR
jgi:hypothetical protein